MKKRWVILAGLVAGLGMSSAAGAASAVQVTINGKLQTYDQPPVIVNERTLVPLRGIFEALGAQVEWFAERQTVVATKGDTRIALVLGSPAVKKNDEWTSIDVPPQLIGGRTMVPMRFVSEAFGAQVEWQAATNTVAITAPDVPVSVPPRPGTTHPGPQEPPVITPDVSKFPYPVNTSYITKKENRSFTQRAETRFLVIHETVSKATARQQLNYFNTAPAYANAHVFIDWNEVLLTVPFTETSWTVGRPANSFTINIEMCHARNAAEFNKSWDITTRYVAKWLLANQKDPLTFIKSHHEIAEEFGGTDHTDPDDYFAEYGKTMDDFRRAVQARMQEMK